MNGTATKVLVTLLAAVCFSAGIAGCGKSDEHAAGPAAASAAATTATPNAPQGGADNEDGAIRAAILAHLDRDKSLNPASFDTDIKQITITGNTANAQVDFHIKGGPGLMQLAYALKKDGGTWSVVESNPTGSDFSHPPVQGQAPTGGPAGGPGHSLSDTLRSFKSGDPGAAPSPQLPPGHPATGSPSETPQR